jgi:hypothetical protein
MVYNGPPTASSACLAFLWCQGSDETIRVVSMDRDYHVECYHCEVGPPAQPPESIIEKPPVAGTIDGHRDLARVCALQLMGGGGTGT